MPTYQYVCTECGRDLEVQQSFSEASLTECPACSGRLRKVFNAVGVVFKGSGFYRNDSRSGGDAGSGSQESGSSTDSSTGTKDSGSTDSSSKDSKGSGAKDSGSKDSSSGSTAPKVTSSSSSSTSS